MHRTTAVLIALPLLAGAALAHTGVTNAKVMPRMHLMSDIKDTVAGLGAFAKGTKPFDAAEVARLADTLAAQAERIPAAFDAPEQDPKSEARAEIWTDWPGFVAEAERMQAAARAMQTGTRKDLQFGLRAVAKACSGCHETYRLEE